MAGSSMTFTYDDGTDGLGNSGTRIRKVTCDFTTDDSAGTASGTTRKISGRLIKIQTDPGSAAPSANWDVVVTDEEGIDVLGKCQESAALIARHTTNSEETYLFIKNIDATPIGIAAFPVVCNALTIAVANGGNSKTGQIILFYEV